MFGQVVANVLGDGPWRNLARCTSDWTSHLDSIDIATADAERDGEVRHVCGTCGDLVAPHMALRKVISKGHRLHVVYDAGPCGFVI